MTIDVDHVFEEIGSFDNYQKRLICILCVCMGLAVTFHPLLSTFTAAEPAWRCKDIANNTWCNTTESYKAGHDLYSSRCKMPRSAWEFDSSFTSVVTQWDLFCDRSILGSVSSSMFFVGFLIGVYILGMLSDKFGRKPICFISLAGSSISGIGCALAPTLWFYCFCKMISGGFSGGAMLILWIIAAEFSGVKDRGTSSTLLWYGWCLFLMLLAPIAYALRDWKNLSLVCSVPGLLCLLFWWIIPETPRWLLVHGRVEEARKLLEQVASYNKKQMPAEQLGLPNVDKENQDSGNILELFRTKSMAKKTLIQCFAWFVDSAVYYGVSMAADILGGDMYLNFFLSSLVEIPAHVFSIWYMNRYGRKNGVIVGLIIAAIGAICAMAFPHDTSTGFTVGRIVFALVAKFAIMVSFDALYVFSGELIPTVIRNVGMGTCSAVARIGSFSASYIIWLQQVHVMLPFGIMGFGSLIAGILCFTLPETNNNPTAELLDKAGHNNSYIPENNNSAMGKNDSEMHFDTKC